MMRRQLWTPLKTVEREPKGSKRDDSGNSFRDYTMTVISSEFRRSISGSINSNLADSDLDEAEKGKQILSQHIIAHNPVKCCVLVDPRVPGGTESGWGGRQTFQPVPIQPKTEALGPLYNWDCNLRDGYRGPLQGSMMPNHRQVRSTALKLAGFDLKGAGRNASPHPPFVSETGV